MLASRFLPNGDGTLDVLSLVSLPELQRITPEQKRELEEGLGATNLSILEKAWTMEGRSALLQRRVDPRTGHVAAFRIAPIRPTSETRVHMLPEHRVLLVNDRIQWFDGETVHDVDPFEAPSGWYETAVTWNGDTLIVRDMSG